MATDFFDSIGRSIGAADSLRRRRLGYAVRRAATAMAAGVAVFAALMCMMGTIATRRVVVAAVDIARGTVVEAGMVRLAEWPAGDALDAAFDALDALPHDGIAQVDLVAGQPIFRPTIRDQPVVPDGFTVIEVRLASDAAAVAAGDEIALASAVGCADRDSGSCVLVERALVMETARPTQDGRTGYTADGATALAMPPGDALRVMASQEAGAIVAVAK